MLRDENDDDSVISRITPEEFKQYVAEGVIQGGMIPKLENSFEALNAGVTEVVITLASAINSDGGTRIKNKSKKWWQTVTFRLLNRQLIRDAGNQFS